jgi:hypothetical protein
MPYASTSKLPGRAPRGTLGTALRAVEARLLARAERTARRNAWAAVVEDRQRARERQEARHVLGRSA